MTQRVSALLRPGLQPPAEREEERFWVCSETSDLRKNSPGAEGVSTHHWRTTVTNQSLLSNRMGCEPDGGKETDPVEIG